MVMLIMALLGGYSLCLLGALTVFNRVWVTHGGSSSAGMRLSVIIPFRNESKALPHLLAGLALQDHPAGETEFIFVDDHSTDESAAIISASALKGMRLLQLPDGLTGKKHALTLGAQSATGEVLVFTDADCVHQPGWLTAVGRNFSDPKVHMAIGLVRILPYGPQSLEFSSLASATAIAAGAGNPIMCNGANLACRKADFFMVGGYDGNIQIASGDDEFLMRKFIAHWPRGIRLMDDPAAVVTTGPQHGFRSFFSQRIRWAGKWRHNADPVARAMAVLVMMVQLATIAGWWITLSQGDVPLFITLIMRHALEGWLLMKAARKLSLPFRLPVFLIVSCGYPFYVILTGVISLFIKPHWKGRIATA
ncbi:MAG: glycosyltransferase [Bacteroidota bacterium]